ncbi:MAG TPA: mechanosensitive ion channel family protein [Candidatus Paceibacterota bacterium]|jgi:small-conductance mechanosensitive channel|nr:mechanosensitive ion channel family protein [Candidatus Paceibacterota bacterium]HRT56635.1 mechanosensitive ion channel family protein [Candidatus Paceibacterota bacterium]
MNRESYLEASRHWLHDHGLNLLLIVVLTLVVLKVAAILNRKLFTRLFRGREDEHSRKLAQTLSQASHWVLMAVFGVGGLSLSLNELGVRMEGVSTRVLGWLVTNGLGIVLIAAITTVALKAAGILTSKLMAFLHRDKLDIESQKRADTLGSVLRWFARTAILLIASVMVLGQLGVQIGPVIAAAGVVGLAVGFGAQNLVQDVISGFFLLLEDQIRVGDVVQLNDKSGMVEKITLRMTILRDFAGNVHYVRNGKIDVVTNMTKEYSHYVFDIGVAYREDVDEVSRVIRAVGEDLQKDPAYKDDILAPVEVVGLDKFADSAIVIKARIKTKPVKQWRVGREFNRRLKKEFDRIGIEIPFPHLTIYAGKDKQGNSPAHSIEVRGGGAASAT